MRLSIKIFTYAVVFINISNVLDKSECILLKKTLKSLRILTFLWGSNVDPNTIRPRYLKVKNIIENFLIQSSNFLPKDQDHPKISVKSIQRILYSPQKFDFSVDRPTSDVNEFLWSHEAAINIKPKWRRLVTSAIWVLGRQRSSTWVKCYFVGSS